MARALAGFLLVVSPLATSLKLRGAHILSPFPCANHTYEELLWDGEDTSIEVNGSASLFQAVSNQLSSAATTRRVQILGLFNTGTNLMYQLLQLNFPGKVAIPEQVWKHASLRRLYKRQPQWREVFRRDGTLAVAVVRDPLSWLQSMRKAPYNLRPCVRNSNWLTGPCPMPAPMWHPEGITFNNIEQYWNENTNDYGQLQDYGFAKSLVIRYEDMVMDTEGVMLKLAGVLGLTFQGPVRQVHAPAKVGGGSLGRAMAIQKLRSKSYLTQYHGTELQQACKRLDVKRMQQQGYYDCDAGSETA